jgi:hypothetical protein
MNDIHPTDEPGIEAFLADPHADQRFVRDGLRLPFWMLCLACEQPERQRIAGERLQAIRYGVSDVHAEVVPSSVQAPSDQEWRTAVRAAVQDPAVKNLGLGRLLIEQTLVQNAAWQQLIEQGVAASRRAADIPMQRVEGLIRRLGESLQAQPAEAEHHLKRMGRIICAGLRASLPPIEQSEADTTSIALTCGWIAGELDEEWLANPDLLHRALADRSFRFQLYHILERLGPLAHSYLPDVESLVSSGAEDPRNLSCVIGAMIRDDRQSIERYIESWRGDRAAAEAAAQVLVSVGVRGMSGNLRFSALVRATLGAPEAWRRASAAYLARVLPDADTALVRSLIDLLHDDAWVVGATIFTLHDLRLHPELVVPALAATFDTYEEPDLDYSRCQVLCSALSVFPPELVASHAAERLAQHLYRIDHTGGDVDAHIAEELMRLGPLASRALPQVRAAHAAAAKEVERIDELNRQSIAKFGEECAPIHGSPEIEYIVRVMAALNPGHAS